MFAIWVSEEARIDSFWLRDSKPICGTAHREHRGKSIIKNKQMAATTFSLSYFINIIHIISRIHGECYGSRSLYIMILKREKLNKKARPLLQFIIITTRSQNLPLYMANYGGTKGRKESDERLNPRACLHACYHHYYQAQIICDWVRIGKSWCSKRPLIKSKGGLGLINSLGFEPPNRKRIWRAREAHLAYILNTRNNPSLNHWGENGWRGFIPIWSMIGSSLHRRMRFSLWWWWCSEKCEWWWYKEAMGLHLTDWPVPHIPPYFLYSFLLTLPSFCLPIYDALFGRLLDYSRWTKIFHI